MSDIDETTAPAVTSVIETLDRDGLTALLDADGVTHVAAQTRFREIWASTAQHGVEDFFVAAAAVGEFAVRREGGRIESVTRLDETPTRCLVAVTEDEWSVLGGATTDLTDSYGEVCVPGSTQSWAWLLGLRSVEPLTRYAAAETLRRFSADTEAAGGPDDYYRELEQEMLRGIDWLLETQATFSCREAATIAAAVAAGCDSHRYLEQAVEDWNDLAASVNDTNLEFVAAAATRRFYGGAERILEAAEMCGKYIDIGTRLIERETSDPTIVLSHLIDSLQVLDEHSDDIAHLDVKLLERYVDALLRAAQEANIGALPDIDALAGCDNGTLSDALELAAGSNCDISDALAATRLVLTHQA